MAEEAPKMVPTLGLTGVTVNAMALIAPGAFLWITFCHAGEPGIPIGGRDVGRNHSGVVLAYATAISYSELAKLYPGAGSSYLFAEQAFLNTTNAYRFCASCEVRNRMVLASLLLGISRSHGRHDGRPDRVYRRDAGAGHDERRSAGPGVHGTNRDHLLVLRRLYRVSRSERVDRWSTLRSTESRSSRCCSSRRSRFPIAFAPGGSMGLALDPMATRSPRRSTTHRPAIILRTRAHSRSSCRKD